jgi:hypothetical protein
MIRKSCYIKLVQNLKNNVPSICLIRSTQWQPVWSSASSCNSRDHDSWTVHSRISNVQVRGIGPFSAFLFRSLFPQNLCLNTYQIFCCNRQYVYHIALHHREYIQCMKQVPISGTCCIYRYILHTFYTHWQAKKLQWFIAHIYNIMRRSSLVETHTLGQASHTAS